MQLGRRPAITLARMALVGAAGLVVACGGPATRGMGGDGAAEGGEAPLAIGRDEVARRLARFLWNDESAGSAVVGLGSSITRAGVREVADSMLRATRAISGVAAFYRWWLQLEELGHLEKLTDPDTLDAPLRRSMMAEAPAFGVHLTLDEDATFQELLQAPYTFVDERLAGHYGMAGVTGDEMRKVPFETDRRRGILGGAGVLTRFASLVDPVWPAKRGWLINDPLLCHIPIRTLLATPPADPNRSLREQMIEVTADGSCAICHRALNPPGFAFIGFDTYGRFRAAEADRPGETEGWIAREVLSDEPHYRGLRELTELLAGRDEARRCFVRQWLQYATNRDGGPPPLEDDTLRPSIEGAYGSFASRGFRLRDAILGIVTTEAFLRP